MRNFCLSLSFMTENEESLWFLTVYQIKKDILKTSLLALGKCDEHISQLDDKSFKSNGRITR